MATKRTGTSGGTYKQILSQIEALKKEADAVRNTEVQGVIAKIKDAITAYGLTAEDLGFSKAGPRATTRRAVKAARPGARPKAKVARYRDDKGNEWVGLGKRPDWIREALAAGRQLSDFAVKQS